MQHDEQQPMKQQATLPQQESQYPTLVVKKEEQ
jgi:hypothetical protein